jgi:hypothetical protein
MLPRAVHPRNGTTFIWFLLLSTRTLLPHRSGFFLGAMSRVCLSLALIDLVTPERTCCHAAHASDGYRKAAEQGDAESQSDLGSLYRDGKGVQQDYSEAIRWYRQVRCSDAYTVLKDALVPPGQKHLILSSLDPPCSETANQALTAQFTRGFLGGLAMSPHSAMHQAEQSSVVAQFEN